MSTEADDLALCARLLPKVSRTFALTIRVLPRQLRESVNVAYLMCRLADVLEDTTGQDARVRRDGLLAFGSALDAGTGTARDRKDLVRLVQSLDAADEIELAEPSAAELVGCRAAVLRAYLALPAEHRDVLAHWVGDMANGMASFVDREIAAPPSPSTADRATDATVPYYLRTSDELRSYAYYVAGTVGNLLTDLFTLDLRLEGKPELERLSELSVPFGLGLQFTNIVQDLADDRQRGWSYVPAELASRHGTSLPEMAGAGSRAAGLKVTGELIEEAARYLDSAMEFTLLLPRSAPRVRLFCLWPIFFALRTLVRLWGEPRVLVGGEKVRITRSEVRGMIGATSALCLSNGQLGRLYGRERQRLSVRMAKSPV